MTKQEFDEARKRNNTFKAACTYLHLPEDFNFDGESDSDKESIGKIIAFMAGANYQLSVQLEEVKQKVSRLQEENERI
jgi:hypothetical protein